MGVQTRVRADGTKAYGVKVSAKIDGVPKVIWIGTFDRKKDADAAYVEAKRDIRLHGVPHKAEIASLGRLCEDYLAVQDVSDSTREIYRCRLNIIVEHLGASTPVSDVKHLDAERFISVASAKYATNTTRSVLITARSMFKAAVRWGMVASNPFDDLRVKAPRAPNTPRALTVEEWLGMVDGADERYRLLYAVWPLLGLRIGEVRGLTKDRVDIASRRLTIDQQMTDKTMGVLTQLKTRASYRTVDLCDLAVELLEKQMDSVPGEFVFDGEKTPYLPRNFSRTMTAYAKRLGIDNVSPHTMRHTFASWLILNGAPIKFVQEQLGHATPMVTLNTYTHLIDDGSGQIWRLDSVATE